MTKLTQKYEWFLQAEDAIKQGISENLFVAHAANENRSFARKAYRQAIKLTKLPA
jgi:hypothetical protein